MTRTTLTLIYLNATESCQTSGFFVKRNCSSASLQAYQDELYVWFAEDNLIHVYNMEGKLKRLWKHSCPSKIYNKMRVMSDKVIVPKSQLNH